MFKYFIGAAVVIWLLFIFILSQQPATESSKLSQQVTDVISVIVEKVSSDTELQEKYTNHYIRKNAHFFIFLVLGGLLVTALNSFGLTGWKGILGSFLLCVLFAIFDEAHQLFVAGRRSSNKGFKVGYCWGKCWDYHSMCF